jgi:hypothetical protein
MDKFERYLSQQIEKHQRCRMSRSSKIDTYNNRDEQLENWFDYQIADGTVHTLERVLEKYKSITSKEQKNK